MFKIDGAQFKYFKIISLGANRVHNSQPFSKAKIKSKSSNSLMVSSWVFSIFFFIHLSRLFLRSFLWTKANNVIYGRFFADLRTWEVIFGQKIFLVEILSNLEFVHNSRKTRDFDSGFLNNMIILSQMFSVRI